MNRQQLLEEAQRLSWFHRIDLGEGIITRGTSTSPELDQPGAFPVVAGKSVLDIGAWDGRYSFRAEQDGAARVVALDHYVWGLDWERRASYWARCAAAGTIPDQASEDKFVDLETLPGQRPFQVARQLLASRVEDYVADFMTVDLEALGTFDVVLYFGVLYHMREPLVALERLRRITTTLAAIETEAIWVPGHEESSLVAFYADNQLNADYGNWYAPSVGALHGMCRAAGFRTVETKSVLPFIGQTGSDGGASREPVPSTPQRYRLVVHARP